jgi:phosphatidylserine decarboxylase
MKLPIAPEGWPYVVTLLVFGGLAALWSPAASAVLIALGIFTLFFFRDPERSIPSDPRLVVSPADGRVVKVVPLADDHPLGTGAHQISIFLSIFNVHVNRAPIGGRIVDVAYHKGEFLPAFDDKASLRNEQNTVTVEDGTTRVVFKQIAGLIARRIVFRKRKDDAVARGERVGLIKFGSRVDIFLPRQVKLSVKVGDRLQGAASVIGEIQ